MISSSIGTRRMPGDFFDTNVLVYMASGRTAKADRAERLVRDGGIISVQVLNEIANVGRRSARPARSPETLPAVHTGRPLTKTCAMPAAGRVGSAKVARSMTVSGSNTVRSA